MRPVSSAFLAAVGRSHRIAHRVDVYRTGQVVAQDIPIADAVITRDRTADVMGRCTVTVVDPTLIPTSPTDLLAPFGNELRVWRGVTLSTGAELVSLGFYRIQSFEADDPARAIVITGYDRAQALKDATFADTYVVRTGLQFSDAIAAVLADGYPGTLDFSRFTTVPTLTPLLVFDGHTSGGHWGAAQGMARSVGCEVFFDGDGFPVLRYIPTPQSDPVASITDGENGVLISAGKGWDRTSGYNAVAFESSNPAVKPPVRGFASDDDPASATYYRGPYGQKQRPTETSPFIASQAQAQAMASGELQQVLGAQQTIKAEMVPNPALEPGDVVHVTRPALKISEVAVIDAIEIGVTAQRSAVIRTRARQVSTGSATTGGRLLFGTNFSDGLGPFAAVTTDPVIFPVTNGSVHLYRPAQVTTDSAGLHIQAQKVGAQWYSGMVTTRLTQGFTPPFRSVWHFRASTAVGMWPTLWWYPWPVNPARPEGADGPWPNSGEGDGFESIGNGRIYMTAHMANPIGSVYPAGYVRLPAVGIQNWVTGDVSTWHTMEYHMIPSTGMRWYLDGVLVQSTGAGPLAPRPWADGPWYPRINMAVGSTNGFPPMPDGTTPTSGNMYDVDLFQVWSL